jgi:hypothetical protein
MEQIIETPVQVSKKSNKTFQHIKQKRKKATDTPIDNRILANALPQPLLVVQTAKEQQELYDLWDAAYKEVYPDYKVNRNDPHNTKAHILYTRDKNGNVASSIRLTIDSSLGIPSEKYYQHETNRLRERGYKLMEFGRMVYIGQTLKQMKTYYRAIYQVAKAEHIDIIMMSLKQKDVAFHHNLIGAKTLLVDMGMPTGGEHKMSSVAWDIKNTKARFFKWTGIKDV